MSDDRNDFQKKIGVGERQYVFGKHVGKKKVTSVINDNTGKVGGKQIEHWSGRVDAVVKPPRTHISTKTQEI